MGTFVDLPFITFSSDILLKYYMISNIWILTGVKYHLITLFSALALCSVIEFDILLLSYGEFVISKAGLQDTQ